MKADCRLFLKTQARGRSMWFHHLRKKVDIAYHNSVTPINDKNHWIAKKSGFILSKFEISPIDLDHLQKHHRVNSRLSQHR